LQQKIGSPHAASSMVHPASVPRMAVQPLSYAHCGQASHAVTPSVLASSQNPSLLPSIAYVSQIPYDVRKLMLPRPTQQTALVEFSGDGAVVGVMDGAVVGLVVGVTDGAVEEVRVGGCVGPSEGVSVGASVGTVDGVTVGALDGAIVGACDGVAVGATVGAGVGPAVVGKDVGVAVGCALGL
jgi:hypothetical protein